MKSTLFQDFDERAQEVSRYFLFLKNLEQGSIRLSMGNAKNTKTKSINNDLEKTLKATGFLLLYNLVESTMRNAITTIFDEFKNKSISFDDATDKIKKIIIKNFKDNNSTDTLLQSINNISCDIISSGFDKEKLFSGNLDAKKYDKHLRCMVFHVKQMLRKLKTVAIY